MHKNPQTAALHPYESFWVNASAGTGKTRTLTYRVISLLLAGNQPETILCLTFTKAAAQEMKHRILDTLGKWVCIPDDEQLISVITENVYDGSPPFSLNQAHCEKVRSLYGELSEFPDKITIETIHAFCQKLILKFPFEAKISPYSQLIDDEQRLQHLKYLMDHLLSNPYLDDQLKESLTLLTEHLNEQNFQELLDNILTYSHKLQNIFYHYHSLSEAIEECRVSIKASHKSIEQLIESFCQVSFCSVSDKLGFVYENGTQKDIDTISNIDQWFHQSHSERICSLWPYIKTFLTGDVSSSKRTIRQKFFTKKISDHYPDLYSFCEEEAQRCLKFVEEWKTANLFLFSKALLTLCHHLVSHYQARKQKKGELDYNDLIFFTAQLLEQDNIFPWIHHKLGHAIHHLLVDEAQDTSPDQWRVIMALAKNMNETIHDGKNKKTLFIVGDSKQSIYSFQGADVENFEKIEAFINDKMQQLSLNPIMLNKSFRTTSPVLSFVDDLFSNTNAQSGVVEKDLKHVVFRENLPGHVHLWPLIPQTPLDPKQAWKPPVERSLSSSPRQKLSLYIAQEINELLSKNIWLSNHARHLEPKDIMILVRRRSGFIDELIKSLKQLNIPVSGLDRLQLNCQLVVQDLLACAKFCLLPEDDLNLACLLKTPLFNWSEEALFQISHNREEQTLWQSLNAKKEDDPLFSQSLCQLNRWLDEYKKLGIFHFFSQILQDKNEDNYTGKQLFLSRLGQEANDVLDEFLSLSLSYEEKQNGDLQLFVHWLETSDIELKRQLDNPYFNAVRIMTVHGSKGLQAPIVFLPDTTQIPRDSSQFYFMENDKPILAWSPKVQYLNEILHENKEDRKQKMKEEYNRLLYVAMTRAEDDLYICGWESGTKLGTLSWYHHCQETMDENISAESSFFPHDKDLIVKTYSLGHHQEVPQPEAIDNKTHYLSLFKEPLHTIPVFNNVRSSEISNDQSHKEERLAGEFSHKLLEVLPNFAQAEYDTLIQNIAKTFALSEPLKQNCIRSVLHILSREDLKWIFSEGSHSEVEFTYKVKGESQSIRLDRLVMQNNMISIIDYKTAPDETILKQRFNHYYEQIEGQYKTILKQIYPDKEIYSYILWLNEGNLYQICADGFKRCDNVLETALPSKRIS